MVVVVFEIRPFVFWVIYHYVRIGGIKRQMRRGNWNRLGPHLSKVVIALSLIYLMVMIQQKSLLMWPTLSISMGLVWTLQHHQWCFAVGRDCLALASWMRASIEPTVHICTRPCHPPPIWDGSHILVPYEIFPLPPCGVVGVWHCPPPPPVVW